MLIEQRPDAVFGLKNVDRLVDVVFRAHAQRTDECRECLHLPDLIPDRGAFGGKLRGIAGCADFLHRVGIDIDDVIGRCVELTRIDDRLAVLFQLILEALNESLGSGIVQAAEET